MGGNLQFQFEPKKQLSEHKALMANTVSAESGIKLPSLVNDTTILGTLHGGIAMSARAKAAKIINEQERKGYRKAVTKTLMGVVKDGEQHEARSDFSDNRPFKAHGTLEKPLDSNSEFSVPQSHKSESYI